MKKLMTILAVFALCGTAMATAPIDLSMDTTTKKEWVRNRWGEWEQKTTTVQVPTIHTYTNAQGATGLNYTVTESSKYNTQPDDTGTQYDRSRAQVYFTTTTNVPENKVLAVQFLGAEIEDGNQGFGYDPSFKVQDYGIYLYNPETGKMVGDYLSVKDYGNYFGEEAGITAGKSFGVYYQDKNGDYITTTGNTVGNFDDDTHALKVYDAEPPEGYTATTEKHFLCLFQNSYESGKLNQTHWEFMLQTTLDDPYFPVNPNDFNTDVVVDDPVVNGQPLPGTLATLLIGGLCAGSLRKRNKK